MSYRLNHLIGRIAHSSKIQTVTPRFLNNVHGVRTMAQKTMPRTNMQYAPLCEKLKANQALFQAENDIPVHLKGGPADRILVTFSMISAVLLYMYSLGSLINMARNKKK